MRDVTTLGVDGCPGGGWIGAFVTFGGTTPSGAEVAARRVRWLLLPDAAAVLRAAESADATGIDMPIGLPEAGSRECDRAARVLLGARRSSVFPAPVRAVLGAGGYREACTRSVAASGRALPVQVWALVPRIADLDAQLTPARQRRVVEVHPELAFARMAGAPLAAKKTAAGYAARLTALGGWLTDAETVVATAPRPARRDDAADALACAWSARRWAAGVACVVPDDPPTDARGLRMEIVS